MILDPGVRKFHDPLVALLSTELWLTVLLVMIHDTQYCICRCSNSFGGRPNLVRCSVEVYLAMRSVEVDHSTLYPFRSYDPNDSYINTYCNRSRDVVISPSSHINRPLSTSRSFSCACALATRTLQRSRPNAPSIDKSPPLSLYT